MSKVALLVGINYRDTAHELNGCINDVEHVKEYLISNGYDPDSIIVLTDDTGAKPTRTNIMAALFELILSSAKNIYFHYSGHGSYVRDEWRGDESDRRDECLCPIDNTLITDDELRGILQSLRPDQSLFAVLDCCHSGTGMDLCYGLYERYSDKRLLMVKDVRASRETKGQVVMLSGCLDHQTSADAWISGKYQGALTSSYLQVMQNNNTKLTYRDLITQVRDILDGDEKTEGFTQIPFLTSGKNLNLDLNVKI